LTLAWPELFRANATPSATAPATETAPPAVTPAPAATTTPDGAAVETEPPLLRPVATVTPGAPPPAGDGLLPITRLDLQRVYEAQGFEFRRSQLGDDREHWVAASPDQLALVDVVGAEAAEQASVTVFGPVHAQAEDGPQRAVYMLTMLNAVLPGWTGGVEWFSEELVNLSRQAGDFEASITQAGVVVHLALDAQQGALTLSFEPE
jgi:hypothetical protein